MKYLMKEKLMLDYILQILKKRKLKLQLNVIINKIMKN